MRWAVGDIHGMLAPLRRLVDAVRARDAAARFLFVGDYVNRGPDGRGVVELMLALGDRAACCRGNHDDGFDLVLSGRWEAGEDDAYSPAEALEFFVNHGLPATLASYGVKPKALQRALRAADGSAVRLARDAVPAEHKRFFRRLPLVLDEPDALVAHAFWPAQEPNDAARVARRAAADATMRYRMVWERWSAADLTGPKPLWTRRGVFGHTPTLNYAARFGTPANLPLFGPRVALVDTGCAVQPDGRLTALCLETDQCVQVPRDGGATIELPGRAGMGG